MLKPPKLNKGDTVAFLAPAGGLAALVPHRLERGIEFFKKQGYKVKVFPTARSRKGLSSDTPENRAKDINEAFKDKKVKAIVSTIGGNSAHQTLEYINFKTIKENPKIFCGYSDITTLHLTFYSQCKLAGFYGPAVITQFGEHPDPDKYTLDYFFRATEGKIGRVEPSKKWTDHEGIDWSKKEDLKKKRKFRKNRGYEWLRDGKAKGNILGGCLPVIMHLAGTKYWPSFKNKILLLETPEGDDYRKGETLANVDSAMADLRNLNVFKEIKGIILGRGYGYTNEQVEKLKEIILMNTRRFKFPILYGVDVGHSDPMITVPLGVKVEIDSKKNLFSINESAVTSN